MAHLAKFSGGIEGAKMYAHWSRAVDDDGNYATYSREHGGAGHINRDETHKNFTLGVIHDYAWVKQRLQGVYQKPGQKKPVESCDIIVTLPKSESQDVENVRKFFEAVRKSLMEQYGKHNNVIGAWVHMDEAQPHIHFAFLPISPRKSKQKPEFTEKLAVHDYWPKKNSLQLMHKKLQADLDRAMGRHVEGLNNGITKEQGGNKSIVQLKAESRKLEEHIEKYRGDVSELEGLKGQHESPMFGEEHYKLSPYQYKRLRALAKVGVEEQAEYQRMKQENIRLETENLDMKRRMQRYAIRAKEEADDAVRRELDEAQEKLEHERRELGESQEKLEQERRKQQALSEEAKNYLAVPRQFRHIADEYMKFASEGYQEMAADVLRVVANARRDVQGKIISDAQVAHDLMPTFQALGMSDGKEWINNASKLIQFVRSVKQEAAWQRAGLKEPTPQPQNWVPPRPSQVNYKKTVENNGSSFLAGLVLGNLGKEAYATLIAKTKADEPEEYRYLSQTEIEDRKNDTANFDR